MTPIKVTFVMTHPIQYYAPWFRHVAAHAAELDLTVVYATEPSPDQQGVGFDRPFTWDVPLKDGYRSIVVRPSRTTDRVDSSSFTGLDVPEIGRAVAATAPDVVVITGWYSITLVRALLASRRLGVPVLYRGDSHMLSAPAGWRRPLWTAKTSVLLKLFAGYLSPGRRVHEYLRRFDAPAHRIFHVPHGVDNALFASAAAPFQKPDVRAAARAGWGIDRDAFVPLFIGKLIESKRIADVVRAVGKLGSGATLVVAGSGPMENSIRAEAEQLNVDVRLIGFLNQTELGKAYAVADCLVLPGPETWGLVVNEAMATGLPVVVNTSAGCVPDLVREGETGYTYPLGRVEALTDRLERVRLRKSVGPDWGEACRSRVGSYGHDAMTKGLVCACRSVMRHSAGAEPEWMRHTHRVVACCGQMVINGGLERMTFEALRVLHEAGAAILCIVNGWENFRITPMAESIGASWSTGPYRFPLTRRHLTPIAIWRMVREIVGVSLHLLREARRIDATHVFVPDFLIVLRNAPALVMLRWRGVRVIARLGNAPDPGTFYRRLWRYGIAPFVDTFACNSTFTARELRAHGIDDSKIVVIPNVAPSRAQPWTLRAERVPLKVVYAGQIIREKGLDLLLEAIALLRGRGLPATLDVVGDMDGWEPEANRGYRAALRERAAQPDLAGAVTFLGWREDLPAIFARATVHCCPSRPEQREAFGIVVLEAKLCGLPSVVFSSGFLPDLVHHRVDGWICPTATAEALADGLRFFLEDGERTQSAGRAARDSARRFSPERYAEAWQQVFA